MSNVKMEDLFNQAGKNEDSKTEAVGIKNGHKPALSPKKPKRPKNMVRLVIIAVGILAALGLMGWGVYSFIELQKVQNPEYAEQQARQESQILIDKVSKLMELPDEEAVVATVEDKAKLADQSFFAKAENGDKVLIFSENSMAVIYRESTNKIINSGPIAITSAEDSATEAPAAE